MNSEGRNRFVLTIDVELTLPVAAPLAQEAANLLASDVAAFLQENDWGFGRARVESVHAPKAQFAHGDFEPETETGKAFA